MILGARSMGYSHVNTQELEFPHAVPLGSSSRAIDQSPCQPHLDLNYTQMMDIANKKPIALLTQEKAAAEQLLVALGNNAGVSNRISKLSNEQIRIFFPCVYVEAKHKLNPITAYNTKDMGYGDEDEKHDDNVAMLLGYGNFLTAVKEAADGKEKGMSLDARADLLLNSYHHLAGTLINEAPSEIFKSSAAESAYRVPEESVFKPEDIYAYFRRNSFQHPLKTISCGHVLGILPMNRGITYCTAYESSKKDTIMHEILMKYISAIDSGNVGDIIQTTVDYQFLHLLPNANGRSSQIMRDCALMHLGRLPLSSLTTNSHYLSPLEPIECEHFSFMEEISEEILSAVEQQNLTLSLCKKGTPILATALAERAKTPAIEFDVKQFLGKEAKKYLTPQPPKGSVNSFA